MSQAQKTYTFGGKTWEQAPLVLGQWRQLQDALAGLEIPLEAGAHELLLALGDRLPMALAVVLTEQGRPRSGKDLPALAEEIEFSIPPEVSIQVVRDFFGCNPVGSIFDQIAQAIGEIRGPKTAAPTGSSRPASSSAEATGPSASASSGAPSRPKRRRGSATGSATSPSAK